jgi:hypothetical protein
MRELQALGVRRQEAARWYAQYRQTLAPAGAATDLSDTDIDRLVHELR